ncbi:acyl-CoA N-acyltransferase [Boeremia exigua]|uniref:acyl-CoA N-acyltransferase n=1 Tax=Boeremia exigua TaxID=749465 RepID=UPI001E8ECC0E|nr:acyl-CoA N-acyltransferase [Boeremia exigua]KAH6618643.1 acyl-CoA N-acyltransferase [Boeremia exigua]
MLQSSLSGWLKKSTASKENAQPLPPPPVASAAPKRPPPPPKSVSAPPRMPMNRVPSSTTPLPKTTEQWNDIPEDFLSAPSSRPRSKKSPRPSATGTPANISRVPTPLGLASETTSTPTETPSTADSTPPIPSSTPSIPALFSLRPLPANVELAPLTHEHLDAFKRLNALTLPIPYPESFYKETMTEPHHSITLIALWHSDPSGGPADETEAAKPRLIGAIRCRLLPSAQLYISTIGVLAPYRTHGIAMHLLQAVVKTAVAAHGVRCVTAHVWEANDEGLEWYKKRRFEILGKEEAYYRKLRPQGAFLMRKTIGVGDLLASGEAR